MLNNRTPCDDKDNNYTCPYNATTQESCNYWCGRTDFPKAGEITDRDTLSQEIPEGNADFAEYIRSHPYYYAED